MTDDLKRLLDEAQTDEPWTVERYGDGPRSAIAIHRSTEDRICFMPTIRHPAEGVQFEANAALIVAAVNALPELLARVRRLEGALETIAKSKYGKCPIEGHWPPEKPCTLCGDLGFFDDDPQYNPSKDGHCVEGGARVVARAALNWEPKT